MNTSITGRNKLSSRRSFLKVAGATAAGLVLPHYLFGQEAVVPIEELPTPAPIQTPQQDTNQRPQQYANPGISEQDAIHRIVSGRFFRFPKFPIDGAVVNVPGKMFEGIETLEYQQQNGLSLIDSKEELCQLAEGISRVYNPCAINPQAFEQLVTTAGLPIEFAQALKNGQSPSKFDLLAQYLFAYQHFRNNYGVEWVSYKDPQGRLMVTGSECSIVETKSDGNIRRPRGEARPLRDFFEALGGLFTGQGFKSAEYTRNDVNRVPARGIGFMQGTSTMPLASHPIVKYTPGISLPYAETVATINKYQNFPPHKVDLIWQNENNQMELRDLNTSGPMNPFAYEIAKLEERVGNIPVNRRNRLTIGGPNKNMISPLSAGNQLSTRSGLLGIESYSFAPANNFFVDVRKTTGVSGNLRNYGEYQITVAFGQEALYMAQHARDRLFFLSALENAAIGFAFGGPWGAIAGGVKSLFDGVWAYFEGKNPPKSTLLSDNRHYVSNLEARAADVFSILNNSHELSANTLIVANYKNNICVTQRPAHIEPICRQVMIREPGFYRVPQGQMLFQEPGQYNVPQACAPVACAPTECIPQECMPQCTPCPAPQLEYVPGRTYFQNQIEHRMVPAQHQYMSVPATGIIHARDAYGVSMQGNCVRFCTTECGANHILGLLYGGLMTASFNFGRTRTITTPSQGGVTGGRSGLPMGDGFHGVTGGRGAGGMGNSYGGAMGGGRSGGGMGNSYGGVMGGRN